MTRFGLPLKSFCCGPYPLETGIQIIAGINIVFGLVLIAICAIHAITASKLESNDRVIAAIFVFYEIFWIALNMLLLFTCVRNRPRAMGWVWRVLGIITLLWILGIVVTVSVQLSLSEQNIWTTALFLLLIPYLVEIYFILVMYSYWKHLLGGSDSD